jgi:hypothetical protein
VRVTPTPVEARGDAAELTLTVSLRGAVRASGRLVQGADAATCTAFAAGSQRDRVFVIPSGTSTAEVGGEPFALEAALRGYHGPGTYGPAAFGDPTTTTLTVDLSSSTDPFEPVGAGATETAVISAGGDGRFGFSGWRDPGLRVESGTITWSCRDAD